MALKKWLRMEPIVFDENPFLFDWSSLRLLFSILAFNGFFTSSGKILFNRLYSGSFETPALVVAANGRATPWLVITY